MTTKAKVTLSLDKEIVERIKSELSNDETLSGVVEQSLESLSGELFLEGIASALELRSEILSPKEIVRKRGKGAKAEQIVRMIRDEAK
jgi:hypothetical protein